MSHLLSSRSAVKCSVEYVFYFFTQTTLEHKVIQQEEIKKGKKKENTSI